MNKHVQMIRLFSSIGLITLAVLANASGASANDSSSGCGLGWKVAPNNSLVSSTTRNSVNVTFSNTAGMTTGTSGCAKHSIVQNEMKAMHYAEVNQGQLMIEMAEGKGEHLHGLISTLGCNPASAAAIGQATQAEYSRIFPTSNTTAAQMLNGVRATISKDPVLALQCGQPA